MFAESGLELRNGGFVVVSFRTGDLRAQIAYAVVDATGWHTTECYGVLVGYHTHFYVELFERFLWRMGPILARAKGVNEKSVNHKGHEGTRRAD
jgi:hypothetical protein